MWNGDPLSLVLKHHCFGVNGCQCLNREDTVAKMAKIATRTIFLRRPKRPEVKEWTAVGATILLFERFVCLLFLPLALTVVGCSFLCSFIIVCVARPMFEMEWIWMLVRRVAWTCGSSLGCNCSRRQWPQDDSIARLTCCVRCRVRVLDESRVCVCVFVDRDFTHE